MGHVTPREDGGGRGEIRTGSREIYATPAAGSPRLSTRALEATAKTRLPQFAPEGGG